MAKWLNESHFGLEMIPEAIIQKEPSAELRPDQKDSDSLPDYSVLDDILYRYIELQVNAKKIIEDGFEQDIVYQIVRLVDRNEFKRYQAAPILKLSSKSFGLGRRWPLVQNWTGNDEHL
jgi:NH3-dependent NAD+ synthetase